MIDAVVTEFWLTTEKEIEIMGKFQIDKSKLLTLQSNFTVCKMDVNNMVYNSALCSLCIVLLFI